MIHRIRETPVTMENWIRRVIINHIRNLLKITGYLLIFFLNFIILGCTSTKQSWYKPNMDQDVWTVDNAICNSGANRLIDKHLVKTLHETNSGIHIFRSYKTLMDNYGAKKNRRKIYRRCMETKGYQLITPEPSISNKV